MMNKSKSFNWEEYISYGINIYKNYEDDEAMGRSGISRIYYGAFHLTLLCLQDTGFYPSTIGEGSHQAVIKSCKSLGEKDPEDNNNKLWRELSTTLDRLKKQRKKADYSARYFSDGDPLPHDLKRELCKAMHYAEDIKNKTKEIKQNEKDGTS